jgi:hypothetical protein
MSDMRAIVVPRSPTLSLLMAVGFLTLHVALCTPAAICREFTAIHPFWETIAPYIGFLGFLFFPFFDDRLGIRRFIRNSFVPLACLMDGVAHIGPSGGISGILMQDSGSVVISGLLHLVVLLPVAYGTDVVSTALWSTCRAFSRATHREGAFRFSTADLMGLIVVIAGICGVTVWSAQIRERWPGQHWTKECHENLRQIASAMFEYEAKYGTLPTACVVDASGRPIHSWRVLLLPFLDQQALYDAYRCDEPWDGPNNRRLVSKMPNIYGCRWDDGRIAGHTSYVVITGDATAFPGTKAVSLSNFRDGRSSTILCLECPGSGIAWTEPRDLPFDQIPAAVVSPTGNDVGTIRYGHRDGFPVVFADRSCRYMSKNTRPDLVKALITINGGERFDDQEF